MVPGFSGNFMLLLWSFCGMFLSFAFMCNIRFATLLQLWCCEITFNRAMLLKPSFEAPNDSTEQILKRGITPINSNGRQMRKLNNMLVTKPQGGFWEDYLRSSINEWEKLAGETGITFRSGQEQEELIRKNVRGDGTHASLENTEAIAHLSLTDPLYKVGNREKQKSLFGGEYFSDTPTPCVPHQQRADQSLLPRLGPRQGISLER